MSKATIFNYVTGESNIVKDERYENLGSGEVQLGTIKRAFIEDDFSIQENDSNGTELEKDVDYEFINKDAEYTSLEGIPVWTGIQIINASYEVGLVYITYKAIGSYTDADFTADLRDELDEAKANPALPPGYITGLLISNDTDTEHDILIGTGRCKDSTGAVDLILTAAIAKQIDAAWSVGDDAGGIDTGSVAADTWYYLFLIMKDSDSSIDVLFSLSKTSPTMPAGYTYFRRIRGAVLTDGSANILGFSQKDDTFSFTTQILDQAYAALGVTSRVLVTVSVPPNFIGKLGNKHYCTNVSYSLMQQVNETDADASQSFSDCYSDAGGYSNAVFKLLQVDSSSQIAIRGSRTDVYSTVTCYGFIDPATS